MQRVTNATSRNEGLTNLAVRCADHKHAEQIVRLLVKQEAEKKQYQLSQKERLVKSLCL
jgi:hypothetical protein